MKNRSVFTIFFLLFSSNSFGCSCNHRPLEELYDKASVVFHGKSLSRQSLDKEVNDQKHQTFSGTPNVAKLEIINVFKSYSRNSGLPQRKGKYSNVYVVQGGSNCSVSFKEGEEYIVFGKGAIYQVYSTSMCAGTTNIENRTKLIERLEKISSVIGAKNEP